MNIKNTLVPVSGFLVSGVHAGLKRKRNDVGIIYSELPAVAAAAFTKNIVKAAPVVLDMDYIKNESTRAIVINSGNANAATGTKGMNDAIAMTKQVADHFGLDQREVLVSSTGVIGQTLAMDKVESGITDALNNLNKHDYEALSESILTTDTFPKHASVTVELSDGLVTLTGIAKGSGMIHPNMGTMLGFVMTDCNISKPLLQELLLDTVEDTYNMVSVDGDTSTNDTIIVIANGASNHTKIESKNADYEIMKQAVYGINETLAKLIAQDGEGATKLVECTVTGARSIKDAKLLSKSIITSSLVKTALFGNDANWGRILCAMGYSEGTFEPEQIDITFRSQTEAIDIVKQGIALEFSEDKATEILSGKEVWLDVDCHDGSETATAWGCDLSYDYVKINGSYRS